MPTPFEILFPAEAAMRDMRICPLCQVAINPGDFRDAISLRESEISGMCQTCQDNFFTDGDEW